MSAPGRLAAVGLAAALLLGTDRAPREDSAPGEDGTRVLLTFRDPGITESSGLADLGDALLTVNDSGSAPVVHLVDKASGETVGRTRYAEEVVDVEALAVGPDGAVWIGDIGDNAGRRMSVVVHRLDPVEPGDRTVTPTRYPLGYVGGPRDAEALLVHPVTGRLFVVSKGLLGGEVFAAPERLRPDALNALELVGEVGPLVTDGAFLPDGNHVVLRSYTAAALHATGSWEQVVSAALPRQRQGEGLAVTRDGRELLLSSEGAHSEVLVVPVPAQRSAPAGAAQREAAPEAAQAETGAENGAPMLLAAGSVLAVGLAGAVLLGVRAARRRGRSTR